MIQSAWKAEKASRPSFVELKKTLKLISPNKQSIVDAMMQAVEDYAHGLEGKVAERTVELEKLTKSMEILLYNMLPASIADQLSRGEHVEPELYESVSLCFTDIVGFTTLAAQSLPGDIVTLLNDLYTGNILLI